MSICGECQQSSLVCPWSREFKPVPGWTASPTRILMYTTTKGEQKPGYADSYNVTACPLYIPPQRGSKNRPSAYKKSAIIAEDIDTHEKTRYASVRAACEDRGFSNNRVRDVLDGQIQTHHGHYFYYDKEE